MAGKLPESFRRRLITGLIQTIVLFGILFSLSFLQESEAARMAFARAAIFSIMTVAGYTLNRLFHDIEKKRHDSQWFYAGTMTGLVITGVGLWQLLASFNEFLVWPGKFALILLSGIGAYAVSILSNYRREDGKGFWWEFLGWLKSRPRVKFGIGIAAGTYFVYIHPFLGIDPEMMIIIEWLLFCLAATVILFKVSMSASHHGASEIKVEQWAKHDPLSEKLTGPNQEALIRMERQFFNTGEVTPLYVMLAILMHKNGILETDISPVIEPLVNFKGFNEIRQNQVRLSRGAARQQENLREDTLNKVFSRLEDTFNAYRGEFNRKNNSLPAGSATRYSDAVTLDQMKNNFINDGDAAGLFTRLILSLDANGRYYEHIASDIRKLTDDKGNPSVKMLDELIMKTKGPIISGEIMK